MIRKLEEAYSQLSLLAKEDVGFPASYNHLTNSQERFIVELFVRERSSIKKEMNELIEEMKGLLDEI